MDPELWSLRCSKHPRANGQDLPTMVSPTSHLGAKPWLPEFAQHKVENLSLECMLRACFDASPNIQEPVIAT